MTTPIRQLFAIIPAAGLSRRMGQPKLLLPLGETTIINRLLTVLESLEQITATIVVMRPDDITLKTEVEKTSAMIVQPVTAPAEMRDSVTLAIEEIETKFTPSETDSWLLIPADYPLLEPSILEELFLHWESSEVPIMIPTHNKKRGHPTFFSWSLVKEIDTIPPDKGLNYLVSQYVETLLEVPVNHSSVVTDIDTPEDYNMLRNLMTDNEFGCNS